MVRRFISTKLLTHILLILLIKNIKKPQIQVRFNDFGHPQIGRNKYLIKTINSNRGNLTFVALYEKFSYTEKY